MAKRMVMALAAGSLLGFWFCYQDARDEHLFKLYACAHAPRFADMSLEEAYAVCEAGE